MLRYIRQLSKVVPNKCCTPVQYLSYAAMFGNIEKQVCLKRLASLMLWQLVVIAWL
jgi:hypothetical protein